MYAVCVQAEEIYSAEGVRGRERERERGKSRRERVCV